jgi:hypothetical protein
MSSASDRRRGFRFSVASLLVLVAAIAVAISLCISTARLFQTLEATTVLGSEIRIIDGKPNAVCVPVSMLKDGTVVPNWHATSLKIALAIQVLVLVAIAYYLYRQVRPWRGRRRRRAEKPGTARRISIQFSLRTAIVLVAAVSAFVSLYRMEFVSIVAGLGALFAIFVFAEDIWRRLPR